jgi:hypothetical protein
MRIRLAFCLALVFAQVSLNAQTSPDLEHQRWPAQWITCLGAPVRDPVVLHFRKVIDLASLPKEFMVHVSADNQFLLHVNQQRVGSGPARGDLGHWRFETYDLRPFLHPGRNVFAATVWFRGARSAVAQMNDRAGFLMQGGRASESVVNTDESWEVEQEGGLGTTGGPVGLPEHFYFAAEPAERLDAAGFDWTWDADPGGAQSTGWTRAITIGHGYPRESRDASTMWQLIPNWLPTMAFESIAAGKVVRAIGIDAPPDFPSKSFTVPPHTKASILIDAANLVTAYPELSVSGGAGSSIHLTYAEALYDDKGQKGNRNEIAGKHIGGVRDEFLADGAAHSFMPLTWRTWRFLQLDVTTADQPLQVDNLRIWFTAYPLDRKSVV